MTQTLRISQERLDGAGGLKIFMRSWRPEGQVRGVVVIVHGFNSPQRRVRVGGRAARRQPVRCLRPRLARTRRIGRRALLREQLFGEGGRCRHGRDAGQIAHILRLKNEDFSRDPKVVQVKNSDPLIVNEIQPTQTLAETVRADERLRNDFPRITLPVLILHGTADKATRPSGSQRFCDTAGSTDKTLKLYEGHFHDLLNDVDKEVVMAVIKAWVADRVGAQV